MRALPLVQLVPNLCGLANGLVAIGTIDANTLVVTGTTYATRSPNGQKTATVLRSKWHIKIATVLCSNSV
jgi:hypothetical protein